MGIEILIIAAAMILAFVTAAALSGLQAAAESWAQQRVERNTR